MGLLPAALKDLTAVERNVAHRAAQPGTMISTLATVLHPHLSHTYGVIDVDGLCGVVSSLAPGTRLTDLPLHRVHVQVCILQTSLTALSCF